jgi:cytoskeletal protein CcmA (bactofilin family)
MPFWNKQETAPAASIPEPKPAPVPPPAPSHEEPQAMATMKRDEMPMSSGGTTDLSLGEGAEFEGKLTFKGTVRIDATFKGSITTNDVLVVGEHARIDAEITCGTVVVHGEVNGNIKAKVAVELHQPARVRGNIDTPSLLVEKGVLVQGELKMEGFDRNSSKPAAPPAVAALK